MLLDTRKDNSQSDMCDIWVRSLEGGSLCPLLCLLPPIPWESRYERDLDKITSTMKMIPKPSVLLPLSFLHTGTTWRNHVNRVVGFTSYTVASLVLGSKHSSNRENRDLWVTWCSWACDAAGPHLGIVSKDSPDLKGFRTPIMTTYGFPTLKHPCTVQPDGIWSRSKQLKKYSFKYTQ